MFLQCKPLSQPRRYRNTSCSPVASHSTCIAEHRLSTLTCFLPPQSVPLNPFTVGDEKRLGAVREVAAPPAVSRPATSHSEEPSWWDLPRERGYVHPKQREQVGLPACSTWSSRLAALTH